MDLSPDRAAAMAVSTGPAIEARGVAGSATVGATGLEPVTPSL